MLKFFKFTLCALLLFVAQSAFAQLQNINLQLRSTMDFPGQTLANVCGYWQNGQEYALLGGQAGLIIVDITNPAAPQQIVQIPGPNNLWKEIKVYGHYAYVTSEGGEGVQIVDLSGLPSSNLTYHNYTGDGAIEGDLNAIHALHIDVTKGYLYAFGGDLFNGGAKILDLNADPYNPKYVGRFTELGYIHDGYADNDTLYACHISAGIMSIVDMADKSNPVVLGSVETPGKFTHNAWITDDRKHVLTTDETTPSFLTAYDVSDPSDIRELDRISPNNGTGTYVHNTHIINDYAVTSWYTSGVLIVDAHRPQNLITVAQFDTYTGNNLEFEGCWGAFPYFPSGTVIATDIDPGQLTVLTPTYKRACYLEGKIINGCNGQPLVGATVRINGGTDPLKIATTKADGLYKTGQVTPGNFTATISAPGYQPKTVNITLSTGQVSLLDVILDAAQVFNAIGTVTEIGTNTPIANAQVTLSSAVNSFTIISNSNGQFSKDCLPAGNYIATAVKWGYLVGSVTVSPTTPIYIQLSPGYYDDFATDLGWTTASTADAGDWVRGEPEGTTNQGSLVNPENDMNLDNNDHCYMTGNGGGQPGSNDVDNGKVSLFTPVMKLAGYQDAVLTYYFWFYNAPFQGNPANDKFEVDILNGNQTIHVSTETLSQSAWRYSGEIHLKDYTTLSDNIRIEFSATDVSPGNWLESAIDIFKVTPSTVSGRPDLDASAILRVSPNPSVSDFSIQYAWENIQENPVLEVRNLLGQVVFFEKLSAKTGLVNLGNNWNAGVYFASLRSAGHSSVAVKLVKQ
ncbi:MAG: choice-of-anchor B family protein [Saprospiraceae bacterium]|nr:choice-of-anchor B family protein [Saprospiraceae bacterium]